MAKGLSCPVALLGKGGGGRGLGYALAEGASCD